MLSRSGRPGPLTPLPVPPVTGSIDGFALSPDGSKLAVSLQPTTRLVHPGPAPPPRGARLLVVNLATGAERDWALPGIGWIGGTKPDARTVSWADDSRTLLFEVHHGAGGPIARLRLLDTTAPSGSLTAASKAVPIPSADISGHVEHPPLALGEPLLLAGDGTKIVAGTALGSAGPGPGPTQRNQRTVLGIQAGNTFRPLPPGVQSFQGHSPAW